MSFEPEKSTKPSQLVECSVCHQLFHSRGMSNHKKSCDAKARAREADDAFEKELRKKMKQAATSASPPPGVDNDPDPFEALAAAAKPPPRKRRTHASTSTGNRDVPAGQHRDQAQTEPPLVANETAPTPPAPPALQLDDIRTEYHPDSRRPATTSRFHEYRQREEPQTAVPPVPTIIQPFESHADFEFAELALEAALNRKQTERLISIFNKCLKGQDSFSFKSSKDMYDKWEEAAQLRTPFEKHEIVATYRNVEEKFEFWMRPLWQWAMDLVKDESLAPFFEWDAQRLSKYDGKTFQRFIHEPWTANTMWDAQSKLPSGGKPLCFILYADKTRLSSFGSQEGYPVYARLANLPTEIRNSQSHGGGQLVGWLPIVEGDEESKNKPEFANFKRNVWHECFRKLLSSIKTYSKVGCWVTCGDKAMHNLFPLILILSADYEEQCSMACIRGFMSKCLCPICLIKEKDVLKFDVLTSKPTPLRTQKKTEALLNLAFSQPTKEKTEEILKSESLCSVQNAFFDIENSDPFRALSWDRMHSYAHGLGGKHIWPTLSMTLETTFDRESRKLIDDQAMQLPRWSGLYHFDKILSIHFADANKYEDLLKIAIFVMHNVVTPANSARGFLMLQCLRHYLVVDMYMSLEVQTEDTIAQGTKELAKFSQLIQQYSETYPLDEKLKKKSWSFPKNHTHVHAFDDILAKGATRNFNTKYNEGMHGPLKVSYQLRTNYKDIAKQILQADHYTMIASTIRHYLDLSDDLAKEEDDSDSASDSDGERDGKRPHSSTHIKNVFGNIILGSPQKRCTVAQVLANATTSASYKNFDKKLDFFLQLAQVIPSGGSIKPYTEVTEFRFIKCCYESRVTWKMKVDYLRCSPLFHHQPRYDCVMVNTTSGVIFAQLVFVFTINIVENGSNSGRCPIALIRAFDRKSGAPGTRQRDKKLQLLRIKLRAPEHSEFILAQSIIRGALIFPAFDVATESLVFDLTDADMMFRVQEITLGLESSNFS